jgi:hypothetical protein
LTKLISTESARLSASGWIRIFAVRCAAHFVDKSRQLQQVHVHFPEEFIFPFNLISLIHRAGFILSLAHLGISISFRSAIFKLHFFLIFIAGMSVVFVGDGESKDNLHLFDQERYISALFTDDS